MNAIKEADETPSNLILEPRQMYREVLTKSAAKFERVGTATIERIKRRVRINDSLYGVRRKPKPADQKEQFLRLKSALLTIIVAIGVTVVTAPATILRVVFSSPSLALGM